MSERVRWGMVGGGEGAFIGAVHRAAAALDGMYELCAGALSSEAGRAKSSGAAIGLPRVYESWRAMLDGERRLPPGERIELVSIVTPNHTHFEIAKAFVEGGFHVLIDKPMTTTVADGRALVEAVDRAGVIGAVSYNYSTYPMVRHAAEMIRAGAIGPIRRVYVEYHQGWLATDLESTGQKQAEWRTDPAKAGAGALGDIGTHAEQLLRFVTGLEIEAVCAEVVTVVPGRRVDDEASAMLRLSNGARATLTLSQVCVGDENDLSIRVHGVTGSLRWRQENPNELEYRRLDGMRQVVTRGSPSSGGTAQRATRLPPGHPEGFIEAFATLYKDVAAAVLDRRRGASGRTLHPTVHDGLAGVEFIEWMRASAKAGGWVSRPPGA